MKEISIDTLQSLMAGGEVPLIDVREVDEYEAGHVPGAVNFPLSQLEQTYAQLDKGTAYHVICQMGGRSAKAVAFLEEKGYDVTNVVGGTQAYPDSLEK
ncbi:rhodanese-like domain-containing protein [Streptococcus caprae]|uniref:Rhodanese-like domain-containing protein n=1 Tax=Streptococcus caprae TaxID=1640501 RepID=A0ABV8CUD7_9STRE